MDQFNDGIDPFPYAKDIVGGPLMQDENQMPGFQWLDGEGGPPLEEEFKEDGLFEPLPEMNPYDYP